MGRFFESVFRIAIVRIAVIAWSTTIAFQVPAIASDSQDEFPLLRQSASHMGTQWHVALYSSDRLAANAAFDAAWQLIAEIDADLSNYSAESELNRLCRSSPHSAPVPVGDHLWTVLKAADKLSRKSNGAFDVTIGPVSKLWRRARKKKRLPTDRQLEQTRRAVGFQFVEFAGDKQAVRLMRPQMQLDLGGIAKGYAVDAALAILNEHGITAALVNGGGDIAVSGSPPRQHAGWAVTVSGLDPRDRSTPKQIFLKQQAIATSGDAWQFIEIDGTRYSHIIDPTTSLGTTDRKSVSVVAPNCMLADSVASALCILPLEDGLALARRHQVAARAVFAADGEAAKVATTADFPALHVNGTTE